MNRDILHELVDQLAEPLLDDAVVILQTLLEAGADPAGVAGLQFTIERVTPSRKRGRRLRDQLGDDLDGMSTHPSDVEGDDDEMDPEEFLNSPEYRPTTLDWSLRGQAPRVGRVAGRLRRGRIRVAVERAQD